VLSLSIGATCRFLFKQNEEDESESVLLESGDALIFGGPCRYILHCVKRIHNPDSAPEWLQSPHPLGGGRLNFTFRYAPEAFGREGEYR
jgi:alkylated DNA repair protein (DNA oxidative demethylase)